MRSEDEKCADAQLRAQELSKFTNIIAKWPKLSAEIHAALQVVTESATKSQQYLK